MASTILTFVFDKPDLAMLRKRVLQNLCSNDHGGKDDAYVPFSPQYRLKPPPTNRPEWVERGARHWTGVIFMKRKGRGTLENRYKYLRLFFFPGVAERI